jgi:hypothetical protein
MTSKNVRIPIWIVDMVDFDSLINYLNEFVPNIDIQCWIHLDDPQKVLVLLFQHGWKTDSLEKMQTGSCKRC